MLTGAVLRCICGPWTSLTWICSMGLFCFTNKESLVSTTIWTSALLCLILAQYRPLSPLMFLVRSASDNQTIDCWNATHGKLGHLYFPFLTSFFPAEAGLGSKSLIASVIPTLPVAENITSSSDRVTSVSTMLDSGCEPCHILQMKLAVIAVGPLLAMLSTQRWKCCISKGQWFHFESAHFTCTYHRCAIAYVPRVAIYRG